MNLTTHIVNFKKHLMDWLWKNLFQITFGLFLAYLLILFQGPPADKIIPGNTPILFRLDSVHVSSSQAIAHNAAIRTFLLESMAMDVSTKTAREDIKMQTRLFYVAILVALLSLILGKSGTQNQTVETILIVLVISMYLLEVNNDDIGKRSSIYTDIKGGTVERLINSNINDTSWYIEKTDSIQFEMDKAHEPSTRWWRKLQSACRPTLEQFLFYLVPFLAVYARILFRRLTSRSS